MVKHKITTSGHLVKKKITTSGHAESRSSHNDWKKEYLAPASENIPTDITSSTYSYPFKEPKYETKITPIDKATITAEERQRALSSDKYSYYKVKTQLPRPGSLARNTIDEMAKRPNGEMDIDEFTAGPDTAETRAERRAKIKERRWGQPYASNKRMLIQGNRGSLVTYNPNTRKLKLNVEQYKKLIRGE